MAMWPAIAVVGSGSVPERLAARCRGEGPGCVALVDSNCDPCSAETLRSAEVRETTTLIVVTGDDARNFLVATVARRLLGVKRVLAVVEDPAKTPLFEELEVETIDPVEVLADALLSSLLP